MKFNCITRRLNDNNSTQVVHMLLLWFGWWLLLLLASGPRLADAWQLRGGSRRNSEQPEFDAAEPLMEPLAAASSSSSSTGSVQCEPISVELCSKMPYRSTRMPNFFRDSNQIEADDRSQQYQDLVNSKCSAYIHAYVCELLAPVCLEHSQEAMRRFEIYPCRSFCRRVQRDCEHELFRLNDRLFSAGATSLLAGFACELLPFESNGGNGTLRGPCHETPPESPAAGSTTKQANNYQPYQPQLDTNIPPFITDTSRIDPNLIKQPPTGANSGGPTLVEPASSWPETDPTRSTTTSTAQTQDDPTRARHQSFLGQAQTLGQNLLWYLVRYSNVLSILTVICLLAALNSKRLRRLKTYFQLSPSSSIRSSTNSTGPSMGANGKGELMAASYPSHHHLKQQQQQLMHSMSPSASSRSLVLIAGNNKQPPSHQLLPDPDPSQKLLHGLQHQRTLINVNGTLERQQLNNRYLIMQSTNFKQQQQQLGDKQQLFNTLDSHSSSNQYDYIQDDHHHHHHTDHSNQTQFRQQQQLQQQQQMYSNILLSSPSHQVLLVGPPNGYRAEPDSGSLAAESGAGQPPGRGQSRPLHRTQPPSQPAPALNSRHPPYFNAAGPYAAPTSCGLSSSSGGGGCGGSLRCGSPQSQRSFQRRTRKSGGGGGSSRFPQTDVAHQASRRLNRDFCSSTGRAAGYTSSASSSSASSSALSPPGLADSCLGGPNLVQAAPLRRH